MCSRQDFYFDGVESGSAWARSALILPLVRCRRLTVLSNTDRSLSNNQIELLNKGIKMYRKKYHNDCFYIIGRKANIIILSNLLSAFSKYAFISFKQTFEWLMNID